jgi:hypothetical protein
MNVIVYIGDTLFILIAVFMFYFTFILIRYGNKQAEPPPRPKIWPLLIAVLIIPFTIWLTIIAWQQPFTIMTGVKGAAHGWVVGLLSLSCTALFVWLAMGQLRLLLKR